jgi:hypothetical protein
MILIQDAVAEGDVIICILAERPNEERKIHHDRRHAPVGAIRCLCGMKTPPAAGMTGQQRHRQESQFWLASRGCSQHILEPHSGQK